VNIHDKIRQGMWAVLRIGAELEAIHDIIPPGYFEAWVEGEFGWGIRTAQRYIAVHRRLGDYPQELVQELPVHVAHLLAAPSTPDEVVEGVVGGDIPATEEAIREAMAKPKRKPASGPSALEVALAGIASAVEAGKTPTVSQIKSHVEHDISLYPAGEDRNLAYEAWRAWGQGIVAATIGEEAVSWAV
jgi:hypothetical protein